MYIIICIKHEITLRKLMHKIFLHVQREREREKERERERETERVRQVVFSYLLQKSNYNKQYDLSTLDASEEPEQQHTNSTKAGRQNIIRTNLLNTSVQVPC